MWKFHPPAFTPTIVVVLLCIIIPDLTSLQSGALCLARSASLGQQLSLQNEPFMMNKFEVDVSPHSSRPRISSSGTSYPGYAGNRPRRSERTKRHRLSRLEALCCNRYSIE
ncbi:hypothetical protein F4776DRAFT_612634 [Hypoxylon sp. NC0597]|nr:hypothetical protein F4776DRAFT_612634 [Hypoxylon sp. NC0597]